MSDQRGQWGVPQRQPQESQQQPRQPWQPQQSQSQPQQLQQPQPRQSEYAADPASGAYGEYAAYEPPAVHGVYGAYAGAPYVDGAGPRQTNGAALAGAILSVLPPLGLVLSAVGLSRAKVLGGAGKTAAGLGIVLSLVFAGGYGVGVYELARSASVDPACASVSAMESELSNDESALSTVESSGGDGDTQRALSSVVSELQTLDGELGGDAERATHADVQVRIQAVDGELGKMIADLKAVQGGDDSALSGLNGIVGKLQADGAAMNQVCGLETAG